MADIRTRGDPAFGKTRWRRFVLAALAPFTAVSVIVGLMASGAMALPITIAGTTFNVSASQLTGHGYKQFGSVDLKDGSPNAAVAVTMLDSATLNHLTQTICLPTGIPVPALANAKMVITADPATASNMVVDATDLTGNAAFTNFQMGVPLTGRMGEETIGQTADDVTISNLNQTAVYTSAGTFSLTGLHLGVSFAGSC